MRTRFLLAGLVVLAAIVVVPEAGAVPLGAVGNATPSTVQIGASTLLTVTVTPSDNPPSTGIGVACNLGPIGGALTLLSDDGTNGDATANDLTFSRLATIPATTPTGSTEIFCVVNAEHAQTAFATISLTVTSAAPPNQPPSVDAGGPYTVDEGGTVVLTATGQDPEGAPLSFAWDLDNNGTFETPGQTAAFSADDGPSSRTVRVRATDIGGLTATGEATVTVTNVAPTATFTAPASALTGFPFALSFSSPHDPSSADTAAGFTYSFDCGGGYGEFGSSPSASCSATADATPAVGGKIRDKDGGVTEYRGTVQVVVTFDSLCAVTQRYSTKPRIAAALCNKLQNAATAPNANARNGLLGAYQNQVDAQTGANKAFTDAQAQVLKGLADRLRA